jgi:hypothetical protein
MYALSCVFCFLMLSHLIIRVFSINATQVIYINGRPFVLRDVERPFSNLEYTVCFIA